MTNAIKKLSEHCSNPLKLNPYDFFVLELNKYWDEANFTQAEKHLMEIRFPQKKNDRISFGRGMEICGNDRKEQIKFEAHAMGKIIDLIR